MEDELARTRRGRLSEGASPPPPPPKDKDRQVQGGKAMRLLCYADDPREPELIGETTVDLTEALKKGETDGMLSRVHRPVPEPSTASRLFRAKPVKFTLQLSRMVHSDEQGQVLWRSLSRIDFLVKRAELFPWLGRVGEIDAISFFRINHQTRNQMIAHQIFIPIMVDQGHLLRQRVMVEAVAQEARLQGEVGPPSTKGKALCLPMARIHRSHRQVH